MTIFQVGVLQGFDVRIAALLSVSFLDSPKLGSFVGPETPYALGILCAKSAPGTR